MASLIIRLTDLYHKASTFDCTSSVLILSVNNYKAVYDNTSSIFDDIQNKETLAVYSEKVSVYSINKENFIHLRELEWYLDGHL